ncbi:hypothetical protein TNCV_4140041 [Trichonephila clavipes]|nr:hypothetical protein TNCV_4140041 [Trichonephila clavipes]
MRNEFLHFLNVEPAEQFYVTSKGLRKQSAVQRSPPKDLFPARQLVTSQRSSSFAWESIQERTLRLLCFKTSQPLTSLYPADTEVTDAVATLISCFKAQRDRGRRVV